MKMAADDFNGIVDLLERCLWDYGMLQSSSFSFSDIKVYTCKILRLSRSLIPLKTHCLNELIPQKHRFLRCAYSFRDQNVAFNNCLERFLLRFIL